MARLFQQPIEDLIAHVFFRLLVRFARAHGAVEVTLGSGLHYVFDGKALERRAAPKITPQ
jgi:hypothetical protein